MKIYLSPSNQPNNRYIVGDTTEKIQMEKVAIALNNILKEYECISVLADFSLDISARAKAARASGCEYYLAIHSNAAGGIGATTASGAMAFYHPGCVMSKPLATAMVANLDTVCPIVSNRSNPVQDGMLPFGGVGYGEIREPYNQGVCPVLVEVNFHDNPKTAQWIIDNTEVISAALARAVTKILDIPKKPEIKPIEPSEWAKEAWQWAMDSGITDGSDPQGIATREMVVTMLYRALEK